MTQFNTRTMKDTRESRGLTLDMLASKVGVTTTTIWRWEQGLARPRVSHLKALCRHLRVPRSALISTSTAGEKA